MLQTGTCHDGENLVAMELPGEAIAHNHQRRETTLVDYGHRINSIGQGRKCFCLEKSIATGWNSKLCGICDDAAGRTKCLGEAGEL